MQKLFLRVKNWEKLQFPNPSGKSPLPWIKFFTNLLAPTKEPVMATWPDAIKCQLYHIWLLARIFNGRIPDEWLNREKLNLKSKLRLDIFIDSGFVWFETQDGTRVESPTRARDARSGVSNSQDRLDSLGGEDEETWNSEFDSIWQDFRKRVGRKEALRHFIASRRDGHTLAEIRQALANYNAHLDREQIIPKFIQHGSTWFNNWSDWLSGQHATPSTQPTKPKLVV